MGADALTVDRPPGWYVARSRTVLRWWDGTRWTQFVALLPDGAHRCEPLTAPITLPPTRLLRAQPA